MESAASDRYSGVQIVLHWTIVLLVGVQWLSHDAMEDFWDAVEHGEAAGLPDDSGAMLHGVSGATILILMLVRLATRLRYGAPPLSIDMPRILKLAAHLNHFAFYVILIALPLAGATAILFRWEDAADLHSALVPLLFLLIAAHLGGVAYHTVIRRDGLIWRMLKPGRSRGA
jgi:cytochrome b561